MNPWPNKAYFVERDNAPSVPVMTTTISSFLQWTSFFSLINRLCRHFRLYCAKNLDFDVFTLFFIIRSVFIRMLRHASAGDRRRIYITGTAEREGLVVL